jgi:hypothetical protein
MKANMHGVDARVVTVVPVEEGMDGSGEGEGGLEEEEEEEFRW